MQTTESELSIFCFDWSEVMFVSCTYITFDQSKDKYGKLTSLHVYQNDTIVSNKIIGSKKQVPVFRIKTGGVYQ